MRKVYNGSGKPVKNASVPRFLGCQAVSRVLDIRSQPGMHACGMGDRACFLSERATIHFECQVAAIVKMLVRYRGRHGAKQAWTDVRFCGTGRGEQLS